MVRIALSQIQVETFYGGVAFNNLRRNIGKPIIVTQVWGEGQVLWDLAQYQLTTCHMGVASGCAGFYGTRVA